MAEHRCGTELRVKDMNGAHVARYVAMCGGRWLAVKSGDGWTIPQGRLRNGHITSTWQGVAGDCLSYIGAADINPALAFVAEGVGPDEMYYRVELVKQLDIASLAGLLGTDLTVMRSYLAQFALVPSSVPVPGA